MLWITNVYKNFQHPGFEISCENEKDIQQKLAKFTKIRGILNSIFKPTLVPKFSRVKVYNELSFAVLLYGSEIWTLGKKRMKKFSISWMKFFRRTVCFALFDCKRNYDILWVENRTSWWETKKMQIKLAMKMTWEVLWRHC